MPTLVSTGSITIVDVNDGLNAQLTNNSHILPADASGNVTSYVGAETTFQILEAGVDVSTRWGFYVSAIGSGVAYRDFNDTVNRTDTGQQAGALDSNLLRIVSLTAASSWIDITATRSGYQDMKRRFSVARAQVGSTGLRGTMTVARAISGSSWSTTEANNAISGAGGGSPITGDTVTLYRNSPAYSETRVWNGSSWVSQAAYLAGSQIIDGSVSGNKITVGSIVSDRIAASTIQTSRLAVSDFVNYAVNGEFVAGNVSWGNLITVDAANAWQGSNVLVFPAAPPPASAQRYTANDNTFSVKPGDRFHLEWVGKATSDMDGAFNAHVRVNRPDGSQISTYSVGSITAAATDYTLRSGVIIMPNDAYTARVQLSYNNSVGTGYIGYIRLRKQNEGQLIVDGAISANHIQVNSVAANKMLIGDTTNYTENSNFQAGNVGWTPISSASIIQDVTQAYNGGSWVGRFAPTSLQAFRNAAVMTVTAGDELYAYAYVKTTDAPGGSCYLRLSYLNASGSEFNFPQSPVITNQPNYGKIELTTTVPTNAVGARLEIIGNMGSTGKVIWVGAVGLLRRQTGNLIVDGAINTRHLTANSVTAQQLAVGDFTNLCVNGDFSLGLSSWDSSAGIDVRENAALGYGGSAFFMNRMGQSSAAYVLNQNRFAVTAGDEFWFDWVGRYTSTYAGVHYGVVRWYDTAGTFIDEAAPGAAIDGSEAGWRARAKAVTAPTGAAFARVGTFFNNTAGNACVGFIGFRRRNKGNLIVDGGITGLQLSANSVTAEKIAAFTINASRLNITDMTNLVPDSTILDRESWIAATGAPEYTITSGNAGYSGNYLSIPVKSVEQQVASIPFPVEPSKKYYASSLIATTTTDTTGRAHITWYSDVAGANRISDTIFGTQNTVYGGNQTNRVSAQMDAPGNAKSARIIFSRLAGGTGRADFAEPIVKRATSGELIVDGTITGTHIKGGTITGNHIEAGSIKAAQIGAGEIIATKLAIGNTDNIIPDADMKDRDFWFVGVDPAVGLVAPQNGSWTFRNTLVLRGGYNSQSLTPPFAVEPGATYKISVGVYVSPDFAGWWNPVLHMPGIQWYSLKTGAPWPTTPDRANSTVGYTSAFSGEYSYTYTNPTGVTENLNRNWQVGNFGIITAGYVEFMIKIVRVSDATLIKDGEIATRHITLNTLNGDRILTDSLDANKIRANSIISGSITVSGQGTLSSNLNKLSGIAPNATVGADWASNVNNKPTNLSGINSAEGAKLGGIAPNATVGADWSSNLNNKPTNLAGINSAEGTKLGGIAPGATVGGTLGTNIKDAAGATLTDADLKNSQNSFQPVRVFTFDNNNLEGCSLNAANASFAGGILTMTATTADPFIRTPALSLPGSRIPIVRVRARPLVSGATWDGACYYQTSGHNDSGAFYKRLATPVLVQNQWQTFEWDMSSLTAGGADYITNTIFNVRLDLANSQQNWEIDWIALGNNMPAGTYVGDMLATEVVAALANITSDDVLSKSEKSSLAQWKDQLNRDYDTAHAASMAFNSQYGSDITYGERLDAGNKLTDLNNYLNGLSPTWWDTNYDTAINGAQLRALWDAAFASIKNLERANNTVFATRAQWNSVSGAGKPETYTVSARGNATQNLPGTYLHGMRDASGNVIVDGYDAAGLRSDRYVRSYTVLWKHDGSNWALRHFDVYGASIAYPDSGAFPSSAAGMAALLNAIAPGVPVVIYTSDEPRNNRLTGGLPEAIYRCGGSKAVFGSSSFTNHSSYVLIGQAGIGEGNGVELFSAGGPNSYVRGSFSIINGVMSVGGQSIRDAKDIVFSDGRGLDDLRGVQAGATVGADWSSNLNNKPTTLGGINSAEGTKLGGIAAGATVGAPAGTNVGGTPAATVEGRANNPAARINEATTNINPGRILIQGATTLDSWRDQTEIRGGAIKTNSIGAERLTLNSRGMNFINTEFFVSADKRYLYWSAGHANYIDDNGGVVTPFIGAGGCDALTAPTANYYYVYWIKGAPLMSVSIDDPGAAMGQDRVLVCTWTRGTPNFNANFGGTIIHGDRITTGTIDANRIRAGTVISNLVQVENTYGASFDLGAAVIAAADPANRINNVGTTINGGKITTGTITAGHIDVGTLSAIKADLGDITAGVLRSPDNTTHFDLAAKRLSFTAGDYRLVEGAALGPNANMVMWYGPTSVGWGSETIQNSRFAFGTDGKVYYGAAEIGAAGRGQTTLGLGSQSVNHGYRTQAISMKLAPGNSVSFDFAMTLTSANGQSTQVTPYVQIFGSGTVASAMQTFTGSAFTVASGEPGSGGLTGTYINNSGGPQVIDIRATVNFNNTTATTTSGVGNSYLIA